MSETPVHQESVETASQRFIERPTGWLVEDAYRLGAVPLGAGVLAGVFGFGLLSACLVVAAVLVAAFFRNPKRRVPPGEATVVAPADGRVIAVGEVPGEKGDKQLRIGIFLSVLNVHVNRMPLAGRVVKIERGGADYHAAFRAEAGERNVYCRMHYETPEGLRLSVTQITGWIARRIVCHPSVGEWVARGERFGLIRFGSRTDVTLPLDSRVRVANGDRVRGGVSVLAELPERGGVK